MRIASFNINGVKARLPALLEWLAAAAPDVVLMQEIKSVDEGFPREPIEDLGYNVETQGQKGFNGVAILSKRPIEDVTRGLPGAPEDEQSRWIEATISGEKGAIRVCGLYLPNGNPAPGPKYDYKLAWMERLHARVAELIAAEETALIAGDYNVIPQAEDARHPENWLDDALYMPETRAAYRQLLALGLTDAFRALNDAPLNYTFWDYQAGAWPKNNGIRIDHILLTPQAADRLIACEIDRGPRDGVKPSDHTPIWADLEI
ncbi:MAG: exodeoxyribonuclease III [Paracoccaceae bacterium]